MSRRSQLIFSSLAPLAAVLLLGAGCGGTPRAGVADLGTTTTTAAAATAGGGSAPGGELALYASCMRAHGVLSFPDPPAFGSSGAIKAAKGQMAQISERETSSAIFLRAERACLKYSPPSAIPPPHPGPQEIQKLLAVSRCMRAHGIPSFPDPNPSTGELAAPAGVPRNSPQSLAALRACRPLGEAALSTPTTEP